MANHGAKRKRLHESSDSEPPLTTDMKILSKAEQIIKRVTDNLAHTIFMDKDIISKINKMDTVNRKKKTIGILGKSGEGKSFLLSAVLGKKNLLPSGCFGSCTAVITQVEANLTDSNYTAEIELFSKEEWEKELNYLIQLKHTVLPDESEELIEIAKEKITALYGADAVNKTSEDLMNDDKHTEIKNLLSSNEETQKISKSDFSEFAEDVACFIQNSAACSGDWYWPLVKSVSIKIPDCRELLEHIVIVDIPGTGDCNKIRDDMWKSKLTECTSVWILSNINRAYSDRNPWGMLKHCIEELGPGGECKSINFICTKTDEINSEEFIRGQRLTGVQKLEDTEKKKICISLRNECTKKNVKEKFENSEIKKRFGTGNDFLQVFTVSSKAFFDSSLNLESTETEIPKLQDDLRSLNKRINRELIRDYVNEAKGVLSLIQSVQLDKDKKAAEIKDSISRELRNNLDQALSELDKYFVSVYKGFEQRLSEGVNESVRSCVESTKSLIEPITSYNTLKALCRKGGCHCPKNKDKILDLNKTLAKNLHQYIDDDFCKIFPVSEKTEKSVQEQIDKFTIIQNDAAYPRSPMCHYIHYYIKAEETKLNTELKREIVEKKKEIYSSIQKTIKNKMDFCYKKADDLKGQGCMKTMKDLLQNTVDEIKNEMFNDAKREMLKKCDDLKDHIKARLKIGLKRAMDLSLSQTSKSNSMDFSKEIEELEGLLEQLSD